MSMDLESMSLKFQDNKVPAQWVNVGYPSLKPLGTWVTDLIERLEFMAVWLYQGEPPSYWLPAFFFPQGFITASLQAYARKTTTPIDALKFKTVVRDFGGDKVTESPDDGVNIHGLFIQGAKWDYGRRCIEDSEPKKPLVPFPVVWLEPVDVGEHLD